MKNRIHIHKKGFHFVAAVVALALAFTGCNRSKQEDTKEVAEDHNDAKFDNAKEKDSQFLVMAAEINLEEIQLGKLAQNKSMMPEVKQLGKMMEESHTVALKKLETLAAQKQITIPTSLTDDGKDVYDKLMSKNGKDFDKAYCDGMVKGHKEAISKFEKESTDADDTDIRSWAAETIPVLRSHLDHAITCQKKCEKM